MTTEEDGSSSSSPTKNGEEQVEQHDDDAPQPHHRSQRQSRRGSDLSVKLFGPVISTRSDRPDHLNTLLDRKRESIVSIEDLNVEELEAQVVEEEVPDVVTTSGRRSSVWQEMTDETLLTPSIEEQKRFFRRVSIQNRVDNSKLVQVKLKNVSYHIPFKMDAPTKETVINRSVCYATYEFFRRLRNFIKPPEGKTRKYVVSQFSDIFLPYGKRTILQDIDLVFSPGQTYVVLGPPGSGKTTLLRAIAGRLPHRVHKINGTPLKDHPHLSGRISYNGVSTDDEPNMIMANVVSFVQQLDIHAPYLTVEETFDFASNCRTPHQDSNDLKQLLDNPQRRNKSENLTIEGLGLAYVKDTLVGNTNVRGVSGGQRRRVTIGEMMQGNIPVACADEISTGLDAAVTHDICQSIVNFAKAVKTTRIVSLLQPGPETFSLFDEVIVMAEGYVAYAGPVEDVVEYFERLGYKLPASVDVADFLQTVPTPDGALLFDPDISLQDTHFTAEEFGKTFRESKHGQRIQRLMEEPSIYDWTKKPEDSGTSSNSHLSALTAGGSGRLAGLVGGSHESNVPEEFKNEFQHSWLQSVKLNFSRHLLLWWRDKAYIVGKTAENIGMAVATGGILFGLGKIPDSLKEDVEGEWTAKSANDFQTVQDGIFAALFMACLHVLLGTTTSTPDDIDGRPIHYKQADANFYHTSAYVVGKLAATLPQRAIEICSFGIPVYWMVGLDATAKSFFLYLAILITYTFVLKVGYSIIAQILPNKQNVLSFGTFLVLLLTTFGGFIVYPDSIPNYYKWLYWSNPMAWTFQALLLTEFTSDKYAQFIAATGGESSTLFSRGFETDRKWIGLSFAFFIPYMLLCAAILMIVLRKARIEPKQAGQGKEVEEVLDEDEAAGPKDFNLPFIPVDLTFEDLCYEVKSSTTGEDLQLLNAVSGVFRAGRMCALMGSSGAGKTTLMDVIALRKTSGTITGDVRLNGFPQERTAFLRCSGYVEQFDVQQAELTVRETVYFSAHLRLSRDNPVTATEEGRSQFVDYVLEMMELTNIESLPIGSYEEGGLSFEQRKRVAIAVELAASPSIIFLDEPTSGLDSRGALVIMRAIKRISDTGRTVCATIHQPSAAIFSTFDDLLLLKRGGETVFFGELGSESCELVNYFESRGVEPICHGENPAAWMLRAYTAEDDTTNWKEEFEQSEQHRLMKEMLASIEETADESKKIEYDTVYAASSRAQTELMIRRVFRIMMRAPSYNLARIMISIVYALLLGTVFIRTQHKDKVFQQNEVDGLLLTIFLGLIVVGVVSVSMAVPVMKEIRDCFYKHRASGMLDHNSVTVAVTLGELPFIVLISAIFSAVYYALVGLFEATNKWFTFFSFFMLNVGCYTYLGQAFACLVRDTNTAAALVGALVGFNIFFSGAVVRPQYFENIFAVGYWTAPGRFAYEGIITTQFVDLDYTVIAEPLSPFFFYRNCTFETLDAGLICTGTMEEYVNFFFGGKFKERYLPIDISVLIFVWLLARLFLWGALWKLNYVNT